MQVCPSCGRENPDGFRLCGYCGASLSGVEAVERRRLATLLFCDVSGSTAMGERVDPEAVQELMHLYFREMREVLARHGGTVEKFIGDAVVAVFGIPDVHEDDALRACRAALEMQARLTVLNGAFERRFGERIAVRIGINTGEVVGSRETVVTGDPVNVAARLEQAAGPGEVLLGEPTYRLVRDAVSVEPVEALAAKGKTEPLAAYRLVEVVGVGAASRRSSPLVGRGEELALLEGELDAATANLGCRLATIVGEPGVGKSRLVAELVERVDPRARVARGACLSYGEGITFWAVAQIMRELAGIADGHSAQEARAQLDALLEPLENGRTVSARIAQLLGLAEGAATADQTAQAIAQFLTAAGGERPLIVIVDDIHWAEPALLDLLGSLPSRVENTPLLLICLARPELLETRPDWPVTMTLELLGEADAEALLDNLIGGAPELVRSRISQIAAGNPLFAEELVAMLVDERVLRRAEDGAWVLERELDEIDLPVSLNALLGARLDRLDTQTRGALERGAVEGELFHRGAVVELSHEALRPSVPGELEELAGKDLIRPAAASLAGEVAYRFKHILVREAAYRATAKKLRALLHERFADWLERLAGERVGEYQEILGYHFEQSYRYRLELGPVDEDGRRLAVRAGHHLGAAGRRAIDRGDVYAAANLLGRAARLLPPDSLERLELMLPYAYATGESGRTLEGWAIWDELHERATALGERGLAATARCLRAGAGLLVDPNVDLDEVQAIAEETIETLMQLGDRAGLAYAERRLGIVWRLRCREAEAGSWFERSLAHADACGDLISRRMATQDLAMAMCLGPMPVGEAIRRCEELRQENSDDRVLGAVITRCLSALAAMAGRFDDAREYGRESSRVLRQANMLTHSWVTHMVASEANEFAGDRPGAELELEAMWDAFRGTLDGAPDGRAMQAAYRLANLYCDDGRWDDAEACLAFHPDLPTSSLGRVAIFRLAAEARVAARRGRLEAAIPLARDAVELAESTDLLNLRARVWLASAEVQTAAGNDVAAAEAVDAALELFDQKANIAAADRLRGVAAT